RWAASSSTARPRWPTRASSSWATVPRPARSAPTGPAAPRRSGSRAGWTGPRSGRLRVDQGLEVFPVGQPRRLDQLAGADVVEPGPHPLDRDPGELGPGDAVDGELQRVGGGLAVGLPVDDEVVGVVAVVVVDRV